jgi:hypothetical protein
MRVSTIRKGRGWVEEIDTSDAIIEKGEYQLRWHTGSKSKFKGVGHGLRPSSLEIIRRPFSRWRKRPKLLVAP